MCVCVYIYIYKKYETINDICLYILNPAKRTSRYSFKRISYNGYKLYNLFPYTKYCALYFCIPKYM